MARLTADYEQANFHPFFLLKPNAKVVTTCRVSTLHQRRNGNLEDQILAIRKAIKRYQGIEVGEGHFIVHSGTDCSWLRPVITEAKTNGAEALAMYSLDRALRPVGFNGTNASAQYTKKEIKDLYAVTEGFPIYFVEPPYLSPGEVRSKQTQRGIQAKKGMRGVRRSSRKAICLPLIRELVLQGMGNKKVAQEVRNKTGLYICHMTVQRWRKEG